MKPVGHQPPNNRCRRAARRDEAGFSLVEVLVALAVLAVSLTAIGSLVAVNIRGTWRLDQRFALVQTARSVIAGLPARSRLGAAQMSGEIANQSWQISARPFAANIIDPRQPTPWTPEALVVNLRSPSGRMLRIDTIRLRPAGAKQ